MNGRPARRLQHVVLMKFPQPLSGSEEAFLFAVVDGWDTEIGTLQECRIGSDLTGARTDGYDYLLFTIFSDVDALQAYVVHPAHQVLVQFLDARGCQRLAFDYHI